MDSSRSAVANASTSRQSASDRRVSRHLPDFFVLGAAKCGTTSMHHYLRQHPKLYLPTVKELDFFDASDQRFKAEFDWYLDYFRNHPECVTGEATPLYFRRTDLVPERMQSVYRDSPPRFLVLLRDPVERAYSHYLHKKSQGTEPLSFAKALEAEKQRLDEKRRTWKTYFTDGLYAERLRKWFSFFPQDRFLVLLTNDLERATVESVRRTFQFLGVRPSVPVETETRLNVTAEETSYTLGHILSILPPWLPAAARRWTPEAFRLQVEQWVRRHAIRPDEDRPTLDPETERRLRTRYEPHVHELSRLIDRDLSGWLPRRTSA